MFSRKFGSRAGAYLGGITLLVLLAAMALISSLYVRGRVDLTRDRQFTLSDASRKTLKELPDIVTIKVIMSHDLPAEFQQRRTEVMDWLKEFEARSGGKVRLRVEDPGEDPVRREAAAGLGIQEVTLRAEDRKSMEVKKGYFGIALLYGDKKEVIPFVGNIASFEYDIVVKLKRLTGALKKIGIIQGLPGSQFTVVLPGEGSPTTVGFEQNYPTLMSEMSRRFNVVSQDPAYLPLDTTIDLLIIAAPSRLEENEKFRIDQFLMKGKPVVFLTPGMDISMTDGLSGHPSANSYEDLLAFYGLGVRKNLVAEPRSWEQIRFGSAGIQRPYPYWIVEHYGTFSPDNPITAKLQSLSFPWASSIEVTRGGQDSYRDDILVRSTPEAWEERGMLMMNPQDLSLYEPAEPHSFPLAILRTGHLKSFYAGFLPIGLSHADSASVRTVSAGESHLLVISNALFATDFYVGYTGANTNIFFFLNALDQLVLDPDLIGIRSHQIDEAPLDPIATTQLKTPLIVTNLLLAPLLVILLGISASLRRRRLERRA